MSQRGASLSADREYRYELWRGVERRFWRIGENLGTCVFIMLNPSTADEHDNDPTIRRCLSFCERWGYNRLHVVNLFAFRATVPNILRHRSQPVGLDNDRIIVEAAKAAGLVVCAWGTRGNMFGRGGHVYHLLKAADVTMYHLGLTKGGTPKHPLYLHRETKPEVWYTPTPGGKERGAT